MRLLAIAALALLPACSHSSSKSGCQPYVSGADVTTPVVSFSTDVAPILHRSCSVGGASCHGDPSSVAELRPFLGYPDLDAGTTSTAQVLAGIVGAKSREDLAMNLVTAGDPAQSFLMHKLDDDQCTLIAQCNAAGSLRPNCGVFMPYQFPDILDVATRDTVRRWIAQGARDN